MSLLLLPIYNGEKMLLINGFLKKLQGNVYVSLGERAMVMFPIDSTAEIEVCHTFISPGKLYFSIPSVEWFTELLILILLLTLDPG